jgi:crotonobetainyl-CoA:carnitine CoA-transferase CaiB-like acyl-CoA transferase
MSTALQGIKVLDFSQMMAGPMCAMLLGDFGAEVIKIEPPEGDSIRRTGDTLIGGETEYYLSLNRNKRGIVLDLKTEAGLAAARKLAQEADVVVENFRPGTADRLGIGYENLRALNPRLIYCSLSGFGPTGPDRDRPALDPVIQAMSGIMQLTGTAESGPLRTGFALSDYVTPMFAVAGILAALNARHHSGVGQRIDLSMLNATIFSLLPREGYYFATGKTPARIGNQHYQLVPYNTFDTADGRQLFVLAHTDKFWRALMTAIDDPGLAADKRLADNAGRAAHRDDVNRRLAARFATDTAAAWVQRLGEAGVIFSLVRTLDEVFADPQVRREMLVEVAHPTAGRLKLLANPLQFSATPASVRRHPPLLGEHTAEVLAEIGMDAAAR